jgi:hypothetical protein
MFSFHRIIKNRDGKDLLTHVIFVPTRETLFPLVYVLQLFPAMFVMLQAMRLESVSG